VAAIAGIERGLAYQPVNAGLGAQPTVRELALYFDSRALDSGDLTGIGVDHLAREAVCRAPAQVHAQQHLRPVLRLGTTGPRLDVEKGTVRVHLAAEHAPQLEMAHLAFELLCVALDVARRTLIALAGSELEQLAGITDALGGAVDLGDLRAQAGAFAPELLRARGIGPHRCILQLAGHFLEPLLLAVVLKETPGVH